MGRIDDLIVTPNEKVPYAAVSVGGFLGTDSKYVVVPYSLFVVHDKQMLLPGATKEARDRSWEAGPARAPHGVPAEVSGISGVN